MRVCLFLERKETPARGFSLVRCPPTSVTKQPLFYSYTTPSLHHICFFGFSKLMFVLLPPVETMLMRKRGSGRTGPRRGAQTAVRLHTTPALQQHIIFVHVPVVVAGVEGEAASYLRRALVAPKQCLKCAREPHPPHAQWSNCGAPPRESPHPPPASSPSCPLPYPLRCVLPVL